MARVTVLNECAGVGSWPGWARYTSLSCHVLGFCFQAGQLSISGPVIVFVMRRCWEWYLSFMSCWVLTRMILAVFSLASQIRSGSRAHSLF